MQDGMDIGLFCFNTASRELLFSGAKLRLLVRLSSELQVISGSRYSVGGLKWKQKVAFGQSSLNLPEDTVLYLFSDGITDQPKPWPGDRLHRLGSQAWHQLLVQTYDRELDTQCEKLENYVDELLNFEPQRDDICVAGIKL